MPRKSGTAQLLDFSTVLASKLALTDVLEAGLPKAAAVLGADAAWTMTFLPEAEALAHMTSFTSHKGWSFPPPGTLCPLAECPTLHAAFLAEAPHVRQPNDMVSSAEREHCPAQYAATCLLVRMRAGEDTIGMLGFAYRRTRKELSENHLRLAQMLANQLGIAIERARLYEAERERREALESLQTTARALDSSLDLQTMITLIVDEAMQVLHADAISLMMWASDDDALTVRASRGLSEAYVSGQHVDRQALSPIRQLGETPRALIFPDASEAPFGKPALVRGEGITSVLIAPLLDDTGSVQGLLNIYAKGNLRIFQPAEIDLVTTFASQASVAIQRARLYDELLVHLDQMTQAMQRLRTLQRIGASVAGSMSIDGVLKTVRDAVYTILEEAFVTAFMLVDPVDERRLVFHHANPQSLRWHILERATGMSVEQMALTTDEVPATVSGVLRTGNPLIVTHLAELGLPWLTGKRAQRVQEVFQIKSLALLPLISRGRFIGVMILPTRIDPIPEQAISLLMSFAGQAAMALEAAHLLEITEQRVRELGVLREAMTAAAASASVDELYASVTKVLANTFYPELFGFAVWDDEDKVFRAHSSCRGISRGAQITSHISEGVVGRAAALRRPIVVSDVIKEEEYVDIGIGTRSEIAVPVLVHGEVVAVMNAESRQVSAFSQQEAEFLTILAEHLATAIERTRLYEALQQWAVELEEANIRLREADLLKSQMVQMVAHELRTPLTFVMSYVDLLLSEDMGPLTGAQRDSLRIVARRAEMLSRLVSDIVTLYVMDEAPLAREEIGIRGIIEEAVAAAKQMARKARIMFRVDLPDDLPPVIADPLRLGQVLDNLLSNAIKFSPNGGKVTIAGQEVAGMVQVDIRDTGIGIPEEQLEHIFERFYQVDSSATRSFGGVGMGLAVCQKIVQAHGGWIWATSKPGEGSTFSFTLPSAVVPEETPT